MSSKIPPAPYDWWWAERQEDEMGFRIDEMEIDDRFDLHSPKSDKIREVMRDVRAMVKDTAMEWADVLPEGREKSLAITHLEEALMWATKAIACNQHRVDPDGVSEDTGPAEGTEEARERADG